MPTAADITSEFDRVDLSRRLQETDDFAVENVKRGGGPFASRMRIKCDDGRTFYVGTMQGNDVVPSGIPSRHAEHQDMEVNFPELIKLLELLKGMPKTIEMESSGQSCIGCAAKEEALERYLKAEGLLQGRDKFVVFYGQTYRQAADMKNKRAFFDLHYLLAMQIVAGLELGAGSNNPLNSEDIDEAKAIATLFQHDQYNVDDCENVPKAVREIFEASDRPVAVLVRGGEVFAIGYDQREGGHFTQTAEIMAIQNACTKKREETKETFSWDLEGATIYTSTEEIGPMMFAEGCWSNALHFVTLKHDRAEKWQTQEMHGVSNTEAIKIVASLGTDPEARVHHAHISTIGLAYRLWENPESGIMYNGASADGAPANDGQS